MRFRELFAVPEDRVDDSARLLAESVARWADDEVRGRRRTEGREDWDALLAPALRRVLDDVGLRHLVLSSDGGATPRGELGVTLAVALEAVGRADTGLALLLASTYALQVSARLRGGEAARALLSEAPGLGLGSLVLPAYGEPSPGLGGLAAPAKAERRDAGWTVDGAAARPQCGSADAALFGVVCDVGGEPALALVPSGAEGLRRDPPVRKTGLAASRNGDVAFEGVVVPEKHLLWTGTAPYRELLCWYRLGCAAAAVGAMLAGWEILRDWGESRVIKGRGGQPLKDNPLVAAEMGEIGAGIVTSRLLALELGALLSSPSWLDDGGSARALSTSAAVCRAVLGAAMGGLDRSLELMGSAGYATEWNIERYWRDLKTLQTHVLPGREAERELARCCFGSET